MRHLLKSLIVLCILSNGVTNGYSQRARLIEFGWDYPDIAQLDTQLTSMQNTPFDGICFSVQRTIMNAFDTSVLPASYFSFDKLKKLRWGKYRDNYIILRGYGPRGSQWFNDSAWKIFTTNLRSLSKAMLAGRIKGILYDPEYYFEDPLTNPWTYTPAQYPQQSLEEVQSVIRKRGRQFITALQHYKTDLSFLSIWLSSMVAEEKKTKPATSSRHFLLVTFIEGILEAKNKRVTVIDGNETAYWHYKPSQFVASAELLPATSIELMNSAKTKQAAATILTGQTVFYDGILARANTFEQGIDNIAKWKWMVANTNYAFASSNSVVWFYSERHNWWQKGANDTLTAILQDAVAAFGASGQKKKKINLRTPAIFKSVGFNESKGYFYHNDPKTPMKTGALAFTYQWDASRKVLTINFKDSLPSTITVLANNLSYKKEQGIKKTVKIILSKFRSGNLIILARYSINQEASAIQVY